MSDDHGHMDPESYIKKVFWVLLAFFVAWSTAVIGINMFT